MDEGQNYISMPSKCSFQNTSTIGTIVHGNKVCSPPTTELIASYCMGGNLKIVMSQQK